ncbi:FMN-binding negative transcriptional regulator [Marinobacterium sedimentorum]|uniref:FMN-binding negative transcriptional regulator n=1 Tax=Marinobacterium sedimentorum TaxID=2927804 RepID=UPI0020C686D4|nr:FMN-binding negative transcriptional regulator [Marinobacterium sedimentorum]MCP8687945.1 FMN-binding negative transcriptional regulator [Marinobacterium sedimentorum]
MFTPNSFRENRSEQLQGLIQTQPLGLLITHGVDGLQTSLLPFLLYPDEGVCGVLRAHLARANPQWRALDGTADCLVVFQGENGYVTPDWYPSKAATQRAVPTWNYIAVEARGPAAAVQDPAWLRRQLEDLTHLQEGRRQQPWSLDEAPADFIAAQMKAIVGIEIPITHLDGKWKLSQNRNAADRSGVIQGLRDERDPHSNPALAEQVAQQQE